MHRTVFMEIRAKDIYKLRCPDFRWRIYKIIIATQNNTVQRPHLLETWQIGNISSGKCGRVKDVKDNRTIAAFFVQIQTYTISANSN